MKKSVVIIGLILVLSLALSACAQSTPAPAEAPTVAEEPAVEETNVAFVVKGKVESELGWSEDEIKAMTTVDVESTNSKGETSTYTGVKINDLLALAKPAADATTLVLVADDGYTAEVPLADVLACDTCIISFRSKGGFSSVLPDFDKSLQVKGIIKIEVK